jgi:hypothetical protein
METQATKRFDELIQKKIKLVQDLLSLVTEQSKLSYVDNLNQYENLVESREIVIEDIQKIDVLIRNEIETAGMAGSANLQPQLDAANAQISGLARKILALDKKSKFLMNDEMGKIKYKIQDLQKGKKGLDGYSAGSKLNFGGVYTDSKR